MNKLKSIFQAFSLSIILLLSSLFLPINAFASYYVTLQLEKGDINDFCLNTTAKVDEFCKDQIRVSGNRVFVLDKRNPKTPVCEVFANYWTSGVIDQNEHRCVRTCAGECTMKGMGGEQFNVSRFGKNGGSKQEGTCDKNQC